MCIPRRKGIPYSSHLEGFLNSSRRMGLPWVPLHLSWGCMGSLSWGLGIMLGLCRVYFEEHLYKLLMGLKYRFGEPKLVISGPAPA